MRSNHQIKTNIHKLVEWQFGQLNNNLYLFESCDDKKYCNLISPLWRFCTLHIKENAAFIWTFPYLLKCTYKLFDRIVFFKHRTDRRYSKSNACRPDAMLHSISCVPLPTRRFRLARESLNTNFEFSTGHIFATHSLTQLQYTDQLYSTNRWRYILQ